MKKTTLIFAMTLLSSASTVFGQKTAASNSVANTSSETTTAPALPVANATSATAFFYQKPVVLNFEQHKDLRVQAGNAQFADQSHLVPLVASEFPEACLEYPIAFSKNQDGQWLGLALTSLTPRTNAFVNAQGQWLARYVPVSVRRYPFILAESGKDQLSLAVDMAAPHVGTTGQAVFDAKGQPSEFIRQLMPALADFQAQAKQTQTLLEQLDAAGLLKQSNIEVRQGQDRSAVVEGLWIVDEEKLRALSDDKALAWFKGGELTLIHAHMLSLRNLVSLLARSPAASSGANTAQTKASATAATPAKPASPKAKK